MNENELSRFTATMEKVLSIARIADSIARRSIGKIRGLGIVATLSAIWLLFCVYQSAGLATYFAIILGILITLPVACVWWVFFLLSDLIGMPERIMGVIENTKYKAGELKQKFSANTGQAPVPEKSKFSDLKRFGSTLIELRSFGSEGMELADIVGGIASVANPLFLLMLVGSSALTLVLTLIALIMAFVRLF